MLAEFTILCTRPRSSDDDLFVDNSTNGQVIIARWQEYAHKSAVKSSYGLVVSHAFGNVTGNLMGTGSFIRRAARSAISVHIQSNWS